ncbi:aromatic ring-hydroxylating dioxygenase subunit alpha, partial [Cribrihabitans sp. XS_ASV171]
MFQHPSPSQFRRIAEGYDTDPSASHSLRSEAYVDPAWFRIDQDEIIARSWQWVAHVEKLQVRGSYVTAEIAGRPIM